MRSLSRQFILAIGHSLCRVWRDGDAKGKKQNVVLSTLGSSAMRGLRLGRFIADSVTFVIFRFSSIFVNWPDRYLRFSQTTRTNDHGSSKRFYRPDQTSDTNKKRAVPVVSACFFFRIRTHNSSSTRWTFDSNCLSSTSSAGSNICTWCRLEANKIGKARQQVSLRRQDSNNDWRRGFSRWEWRWSMLPGDADADIWSIDDGTRNSLV